VCVNIKSNKATEKADARRRMYESDRKELYDSIAEAAGLGSKK